MKVFIDSDILIWYLRGEKKAGNFLNRLRSNTNNELWIGAMQRAEIIFFMLPNEEEDTLLLLSHFKTADVDQKCVDVAAQVYRRWYKTHGTDVNDAILAATVMQAGGKIISLNYKHYPMPEIIVEKPW